MFGINKIILIVLLCSFLKIHKNQSITMKKQIFLIAVVASFCATGLLAQTNDETAIKTVVEKETQSWGDRNGAAMASCWANVPYAIQLVYHGNTAGGGNGLAYGTNAKMDMVSQIPAMIASAGPATGETFENTNYVIRVNGTSAFVHYDQTVMAKDGSKQHAREVRYLEKTDGAWKIVYVGAVFYKP